MIKGVVLANNLSLSNVHSYDRGVPIFQVTKKCSRDLLYDLMDEYGFKRKELVVLTTSNEDIMAAHEAFCHHWLLDSAEECTADKIDEILNSTKFGI